MNVLMLLSRCRMLPTTALIMLACLSQCKEQPALPPVPLKEQLPDHPRITVKLQYIDFTEILLRILVSGSSDRDTIIINRDGKSRPSISFFKHDTLVVDTSLESNTFYSYRVQLIKNNAPIDSTYIGINTRAYGSHNWRFEVDTLGGENTAVGPIIAFSKNDAWLPGDFKEYSPGDSSWTRSSVAHWDGYRWKYYRIQYPNHSPEYGFLAFGSGPDDLWLLTSKLNKFSGDNWILSPVSVSLDGTTDYAYSIDKWNTYFVGTAGQIAHWDGNSFRFISTPNTCRLEDIYGEKNLLYAAGAGFDYAHSVILKLEEGRISVVDSMRSGNDPSVSSVWFKRQDSVFACAGSITRILYRGKIIFPDLGAFRIPYSLKVRGTGIHNIWVVGHFLNMMHFDGKSWRRYPEIQGIGYGQLQSLVVSEDYLFAAGIVVLGNGTIHGIVVRGYRY